MAVWNVVNHTELGSANATLIDVTSISSSYDHLYLIAKVRSSKNAYKHEMDMRFNADSGSNYGATHLFSGGSGDISSYTKSSQTAIVDIQITGDFTLADTYSTTEIWLPDYSNTTTNKTAIIQSTAANNSSTTYRQGLCVIGASWHDTSAIDRIQLYVASDQIMQYSSVTIYGINGAA
jgi:hypothetical protein